MGVGGIKWPLLELALTPAPPPPTPGPQGGRLGALSVVFLQSAHFHITCPQPPCAVNPLKEEDFMVEQYSHWALTAGTPDGWMDSIPQKPLLRESIIAPKWEDGWRDLEDARRVAHLLEVRGG